MALLLILFPLATLACLWLLVRFRHRPWVSRSLGVFLFASGGALGWGLMLYWTDPQQMVALAAAPFIFLLAVTLAGHYKLWCVLAALAVAALWLWRLGPVRHWRGAVLAIGLGCAAALLGMTLETIRSSARIERMAAQMGQTPLDHTSLQASIRHALEIDGHNIPPHAHLRHDGNTYIWSYRLGRFVAFDR